eukprot:GHVU01110228.1.p1 GENE.GHVU01110228.1~~GHVU01110228.1.p1  ORF type:complete len:203 (-),score=29.01 GHVU01110228.1:294-863(-)
MIDRSMDRSMITSIPQVSACELQAREVVTDLLAPPGHEGRGLRVREDKKHGFFVQDLTEHDVPSLRKAQLYMAHVRNRRRVAETKMNSRSSRSHTLLIVRVIGTHLPTATTKEARLLIVDLAGSESVGRTDARGDTLVECKSINKSLACLGKCFNSLVPPAEPSQRSSPTPTHIPFRETNLTRLLKVNK